jgi:beta-galactosidase GanA
MCCCSAVLWVSHPCSYVFHNYHESVQGVWDWSTEHRNLSSFLQAAAGAGLFVNLRIGPYICGEVTRNHRAILAVGSSATL